MISNLKKFLFWLVKRVLGGCIIAAIALAAWAWWLRAHDDEPFPERRARALASLAVEQEQTAAWHELAGKRVASLTASLNAEQLRSAEAARAIELHKSLESDWRRWTGHREEQELNDRQKKEQEKNKADADARVATLNEELSAAMQERQREEVGQARIERRIAETQAETSEWLFYWRQVWDVNDGKLIAPWFLVFWIVWPLARKLALYYVVARFVVRRKPLRLSRSKDAPAPALGGGGKTVTIDLWPGEWLRVKPALVESAAENLARGSRFFLKRRFPITNIACGLIRVAELRNEHAGSVQRVVLRGAGKWTGEGRDARGRRAELAVVQVPEGGSLVLRPRYLAGVVRAANATLVIRSHWRIFSWHAWVTGQFRFLEFAGPCRLIVASQRGVQAETLETGDNGRRPVRRANEWATIGFTPGLRYRPARAESFWSYFRGMSALYDDLFIGEGMFFIQKTAIGQGRYDKGVLRQFVAGAWRAFQKVFGM